MKHTTDINWNHDKNFIHEILGFETEEELHEATHEGMNDVAFASLLIGIVSREDLFLIGTLLGLEDFKPSEVVEQLVKSIDNEQQRMQIAMTYILENEQS